MYEMPRKRAEGARIKKAGRQSERAGAGGWGRRNSFLNPRGGLAESPNRAARPNPGPSRIPPPEAPLRGGAGTGEGWAFRGWSVRWSGDRGSLIGFRKKTRPPAEACPSPTPAPPAAPGGWDSGQAGAGTSLISSGPPPPPPPFPATLPAPSPRPLRRPKSHAKFKSRYLMQNSVRHFPTSDF